MSVHRAKGCGLNQCVSTTCITCHQRPKDKFLRPYTLDAARAAGRPLASFRKHYEQSMRQCNQRFVAISRTRHSIARQRVHKTASQSHDFDAVTKKKSDAGEANHLQNAHSSHACAIARTLHDFCGAVNRTFATTVSDTSACVT